MAGAGILKVGDTVNLNNKKYRAEKKLNQGLSGEVYTMYHARE